MHQRGSGSPADLAHSKLKVPIQSVSEGVTQCVYLLTPPPRPLRNRKPLKAFQTDAFNGWAQFCLMTEEEGSPY